MKEVHYNGLTFEPYITREKIAERTAELARQITEEYRDRKPLLIGVLNGAVPFANDLFLQLPIDAEITYVRLKSYEGTSSTGKIKEVLGLIENIEGRDVIIIEDIVDTGYTISKIVKDLLPHNPRSVKTATLLFKPDSLKVECAPDYVAFSIPPKFIIGYGLDLDGLARNLPDIYVLKEKAE